MTGTDRIVELQPAASLLAIGARLKLARDRAGMSQEEVSQRFGLPTRSLTRWENGRCEPGFEKVVRLAELYGVSADWIAGRTSIETCIRPGMVLVDDEALSQMEALVTHGKTVRDVPAQLLRKPGINYAVVVPTAPTVIASAAAGPVESRMRALWKALGGQELRSES